MVDRISTDPRICHGQACVKGTRIPVHQVLHMLAAGDTVEDLLADIPSHSREDIMACIEYGADAVVTMRDTVRGIWRRT
jgi:uncharacterized protein (DUF433 family)